MLGKDEKLTHACDNCGAILEVTRSRLKSKHIFCSVKCHGEFDKKQRKVLNCDYCGKEICNELNNSRTRKLHFCNRACYAEYQKILVGELNPNYGNRGPKNPLNKPSRISTTGYNEIHSEDHPFKTCEKKVKEHRLVAEKYLLTEDNSIEVDGVRYLSRGFVVHHIDGNKLNNDVNNLMVMTNSEHLKLHHRQWAERRESDKAS